MRGGRRVNEEWNRFRSGRWTRSVQVQVQPRERVPGHVFLCFKRNDHEVHYRLYYQLGTEMGGLVAGSVATALSLNHRYIKRGCPSSHSTPQPHLTLGRHRSICPLPLWMIPHLKVIQPFMDTTGSPISSTNGTRVILNRGLPLNWLNVSTINVRSRALPDCDLQEVRTLKAFIAYDAIVDPDHPLSTGKGGIELYLGTTSSVFARTHTLAYATLRIVSETCF